MLYRFVILIWLVTGIPAKECHSQIDRLDRKQAASFDTTHSDSGSPLRDSLPAVDPVKPFPAFGRREGIAKGFQAGFFSKMTSLAISDSLPLSIRPGSGTFDLVQFFGPDSVPRPWFLLDVRYFPIREVQFDPDPPLLYRELPSDTLSAIAEGGGRLIIRDRPKERTDWILGILFLGLALITIVRYYFPRLLSRTIKSAFSFQESIKLYRENPTLLSNFSRLMALVFYINCGLFLFLVFRIQGYRIAHFGPFLSLLVFIGLTFVFLQVKIGLFRVLGQLFNVLPLTREFLFQSFTYRKLAGLALFPVVTAIPFVTAVPWSVFGLMGFAVLVSTYLAQLGRGFLLISRRPVKLYYIILYFCTLEILPPLVLFRLLTMVK